MPTTAIALFATLALVMAIGSLALMVVAAWPKARRIRQALDTCPAVREMRYSIREVVVVPNDGKVVALALRPGRQIRLVLPQRVAA